MPMHKRILCGLLAALLLVSLIPVFALPSQAASNMKLSETCVNILKKMEGFIKYPVWDNGHYSVGYGSSCQKDDYPNGITEQEADALMREFLADMEAALNQFANRHGIVFSQNQFDALMLFTYNCGTGWLYGNGEFRQAVLDDAVGNTFIFHMSQWSSASAQLHIGLVNRRLIEADMYLNGSYTNTKPSNYTYVLYDNNGGDGKAKVQGFDCDLPAVVMAEPSRDGCRFLGWYSAAVGGAWITELSAMNAEQTLYAHWQAADVTADTAPAVHYQIPSDMLVTRDFYDAPNGTVTGTLNEDAVAVIENDYVDSNGIKWGRIPNGCWVKLGDPRIGTCSETEPEIGIRVTVTGDYVNVRTGPGTQYNVTAAVLEGDQIVITRTVDVDGVLWGKFRGGWVCLQYTTYAGGLTPEDPDDVGGGIQIPDTVIATGTVTIELLNIRANAGTNSALLGCYKRGDKVQILEKTMLGGVPWGRTDKGWICLTYVKLDEPGQPETSAPTEPETTVPETTVPETTVPDATEPSQPSGKQEGIPATVTSKTGLNIRSGAGTGFARVGSYTPGQKIGILEQKSVGGVAWGRTDKGWVCMQYVRLDEVWTNASGVYGIVTSPTGLNIRSGAGVGHAPVGSYTAGTRIVILEQTVVSGQKWGRTDKGWVCMDYVRLEQSVTVPDTTQPAQPETTEPETSVPETTEPEETKPEEKPAAITGIVTANVLNVRATPGTKGAIVTGYSKGQKVTILEQTLVNGAVWGRTDKGWISLAYVKLDAPAADTTSGVNGVITATVLRIRKGPGTGNAVVGTYIRGEKVTILETTRVGATTWGRTDKGWICMDYVK